MKLNRIRFKLPATVLAVTVASFLVFIFVLNTNLRRTAADEIGKNAVLTGGNAAEALRQSLFYSDYTLLRNIADPLATEDFAYFLVHDANTGSFAYSRGAVDPAAVPEGILARLVQAGRQRVFSQVDLPEGQFNEYIFPIVLGGVESPFGHVIIGISRQQIADRLRSVSRQVILIGLAALLLLSFLVFLLSLSFSRPISELTATIVSFSGGDLQARAGIRTGDEIEILSDTFNQMADKINDQIASIEKYSRELESMVQERTAKWQAAQEELHRKEKDLLRAEKMQGLNLLLGSIAHEINNPLAIISGNLQFLQKDDADRQRRIEKIDQSVSRISKLIGDLAFFASIREVTIKALDINSLLSQLAAELVPGHIDFSVAGNGNVQFWANEEMLRLVLGNVLGNAVEELRPEAGPGRIRVELAEDAQRCVVTISDNGPGFRQPERVFEPFYTTREDRKGLGLTYVYHIVHLHNGEVKAENLDQGARVTIVLPK